VMNRQHSRIADAAIHRHLGIIAHAMRRDTQPRRKNELERIVDGAPCLQSVDSLVTMMNSLVVRFVTGKDAMSSGTVTMTMCSKVVLGYAALHHLLLYLQSQNRAIITDFADHTVRTFLDRRNHGSNKTMCRDLGKLLIYLMISSTFKWTDVAQTFLEEMFTRNVRWMLRDHNCRHFDTTDEVYARVTNSFVANKISRRLVMFQVWFIVESAEQTLGSYNERLGRPHSKLRGGILTKTTDIMKSRSWEHFFDSLGMVANEQDVDWMLRFAVFSSDRKGYHQHQHRQRIERVRPPKLQVRGRQSERRVRSGSPPRKKRKL